MDNPAAGSGMLAQKGQRIVDRIAAVDQNRFIDPVRQLDLTDKRRLLLRMIVFIPIIVQADLTDGRDILIIDQSFEFMPVFFRKIAQITGMKAHRDVKTRVFGLHFQGGFRFFQPAADDHHPRDAGIQRPLANILSLANQIRTGQMTVRINPA